MPTVSRPQPTRGAEMEAHAGRIGIDIGRPAKARRRLFAELRARLRQRRTEREERAYRLPADRREAPSPPGTGAPAPGPETAGLLELLGLAPAGEIGRDAESGNRQAYAGGPLDSAPV